MNKLYETTKYQMLKQVATDLLKKKIFKKCIKKKQSMKQACFMLWLFVFFFFFYIEINVNS